MRADSRGFTLLEVLVVVTILALLLASLYPTVAGRLRRGQTAALATQLDGLRQALADFRADVRRYPEALSSLTGAPAAANHDACGGVIPAAFRAQWRGPYVGQLINGNFAVGDALVLDTLDRVPANTSAGQVGLLRIVATGVDSAVAAELERQYDASFSYATGTILWTPATPPTGTLVFQIPIRGC